MSNQILHEILEKHLIPFDEYIYGFANMKGLLHKKYEDYPFGISIGRKLDDDIVNGIKDAPTLEYFYHY